MELVSEVFFEIDYSKVFALLSFLENQLYALARKWKPHEDSGSGHHNLLNKNSNSEWVEAMIQENRPDYEHKHWGRRNRV